METTDSDSGASDWYVLGAHARRAIGYLGAALSERGDLATDFEQPVLLDLWGEALQATMEPAEASPIGAPSVTPTFVVESSTVDLD